jgi:diguanylate cyclase (GGDEF)-like protein/PAS domain S-box-containing protein
MRLERRFHLLIGLVLLVSFIIFATLGYLKEKAEAEQNLQVSAERVRDVLMATRRIYHHQFIDSGLPLNEKTLGFLPAHAINRISKEMANWDKTGFSFNNVSDKPRNPAQKADMVEMQAIEHFRQNPKDEVRFIPFTASNGEPYYHYARPIWIEKYCLECHGERSKAPETIRKLYDTAYDYQVGDLRGILSIKIPARVMQEQLQHWFLFTLAWTSSALILLWLAVGFVIRRDILKPLALLKNGIARLGGGTRSGRVGTLPGEFGDIGHAFDTMADSLEQERTLLASSEERFRLLATTATDAIILADADDKILFWNEGAKHIFGFAQSDIIGKSITTIIPERFREAHNAAMARIRQGESGKHLGHSVELFGLRSDGTEIPVEISLNTWVSGSKSYFVAIIRDITERKQAETKLRQAASVFSSSQEGIMITDATNRIVDVNLAFTRITGYSCTEVIGKNPGILGSGNPPQFYADMRKSLAETGSWQGEISNRRKSGELYVERLSIDTVRGDNGAITQYVAIFSDISKIKEHAVELDRIAHYDPLTCLPNRRLLVDRLGQSIARAKRGGKSLAVCYLDIDDFKPLNDEYGHAVGDRLLVELTANLLKVLRSDDTLARLGGDEFILLLTDLAEFGEISQALDRVLAAVNAPVLIDKTVFNLSASIGVTLYPADDSDGDTLLRHADQAMYRAKEAGKNHYKVFDPEQDREIQVRRFNLKRLSEALQKEEFVLYYQPKVNLVSGEVIGAEALIRWQHPEQGLLPPAAFLKYLPGSDLEIAVGEWVIESVLKQIEIWNDAGLHITASANVSADHLLQADFADRLHQLLERHPKVKHGELELEILETAAMSDMDQAVRVLAHCLNLGVRFALDDFGTGYSSLTYFRSLPVDILKIDQSFVRDMLDDPNDYSIVESVVRMAHAFNKPVIAEGVETLEHGAMLIRLGCPLAQGYGIARPMPAEQLSQWMETWRNKAVWLNIDKLVSTTEDLTLMVAAKSHRDWIELLIKHIEHPTSFPHPDLDIQHCRFGRWYHGSGTARYGTLPEFQAIDPPHEAVHAVAVELVGLSRDGRVKEVRDRLPALYVIRDQLLTQIEHLIQKLATGKNG